MERWGSTRNARRHNKKLEGKAIYVARSLSDPEGMALFDTFQSTIAGQEILFACMPAENHISVLVPSILNGLKHIFSQYSQLEPLYETTDFAKIRNKIEQLSTLYQTRI